VSLEVGDLLLEQVEPVSRHESEKGTLLRNTVLHDHIVGRDAVCGDKEECLSINFVDLADLAAGNLLQAMLLDCMKDQIMI
jgi:hypothetical protein